MCAVRFEVKEKKKKTSTDTSSTSPPANESPRASDTEKNEFWYFDDRAAKKVPSPRKTVPAVINFAEEEEEEHSESVSTEEIGLKTVLDSRREGGPENARRRNPKKAKSCSLELLDDGFRVPELPSIGINDKSKHFHGLRAKKNKTDDIVVPYGSWRSRCFAAALDSGRVPRELRQYCEEEMVVEIVDRRRKSEWRRVVSTRLDPVEALGDEDDGSEDDALRDAFEAASMQQDLIEDDARRAWEAARRAKEKETAEKRRERLRAAERDSVNAEPLSSSNTATAEIVSAYRVMSREEEDQRPSNDDSMVALGGLSVVPNAPPCRRVADEDAQEPVARTTRRLAASMRLEREIQKWQLPPQQPQPNRKLLATGNKKLLKPAPSSTNPYLSGGPTFLQHQQQQGGASDKAKIDLVKKAINLPSYDEDDDDDDAGMLRPVRRRRMPKYSGGDREKRNELILSRLAHLHEIEKDDPFPPNFRDLFAETGGNNQGQTSSSSLDVRIDQQQLGDIQMYNAQPPTSQQNLPQHVRTSPPDDETMPAFPTMPNVDNSADFFHRNPVPLEESDGFFF